MFERIPDSDIIVRPAIMSMVDRGTEMRLGLAARRGDYCLSMIKEQTKPFVLES
jgi:hypothetical protein